MRRNLSPSEKDEARHKMKDVAKLLRKEDPDKWTQKRVAEELGVARETVSAWFNRDSRSNGACTNASKPNPDARVKINPTHKPIIAERVQKGDTQAQVAADYKVSQRTISAIVTKEGKQKEVKRQREEAAKARKGNCGVITGDFRDAMLDMDEESIDLVLTDPPYDTASIGLYGDIASIAAEKLTPGGWLLAYSGKLNMPDIYPAIQAHLTYAWTFCVLHSGGGTPGFGNTVSGRGGSQSWHSTNHRCKWVGTGFGMLSAEAKKRTHTPGQQAVAEAEHFIKHLCPVGGMVCDPCCGSGTTLVAAKKLGRDWIGFEIDQEHADTARGRLDDA